MNTAIKTSASFRLYSILIAEGTLSVGEAMEELKHSMRPDARALLTDWVEREQIAAQQRVEIMMERQIAVRVAARAEAEEAVRAARIAADVAAYNAFHAN